MGIFYPSAQRASPPSVPPLSGDRNPILGAKFPSGNDCTMWAVHGQSAWHCSPKVGELRAAVRGMNKAETTNSSLISIRRTLYPSRVHYIIYSKPYSCPFAPFVFPLSYTSPPALSLSLSSASIPPPSLCS